MTFQNKPKPKSHYQRILSKAEELRQSPPKAFNPKVKAQVTKNLQRFSGKRGN